MRQTKERQTDVVFAYYHAFCTLNTEDSFNHVNLWHVPVAVSTFNKKTALSERNHAMPQLFYVQSLPT